MKNWLLTAITVFLLYAILEFFSLDIFFRYLPHGGYPYIDEGVSFLLQPTKKSVEPMNYVALAGDSYAMGLGDEYYVTNGKARADYGLAPFLHKALNCDVISFGTAGNSSISGMVTQPLLALKFFKKSWRVEVEDPKVIYVLFYEGNDFSDNVEYPRYSRKRTAFKYKKMDDTSYFQDYIRHVAVDDHPWNKSIEAMHWYNELYLAEFVEKIGLALFDQRQMVWQNILAGLTQSESKEIEPINMPGRFGWKSPGITNRVNVGQKSIQIPDQLQGPSSLDLTESEKKLSLLAFNEALSFLKQSLPDTEIVVVYIPSVISSYEIVSAQVSVQHYLQNDAVLHPAKDSIAQSNWGSKQIQWLTEAQNLKFIDARQAIRQASREKLLHGPYDWNHFNKEGYRALSKAILENISH